MGLESNINSKNMCRKNSLYQKITLILFGVFLTMVILEIGLRIGGFTILSIQEHRNLQSIKQKGAFRIICLGESTTQNQYPHYLEEVLNQCNIGIKFNVIDKGLTGATTTAIISQLETNLDKYNPDIVVTMMGINDEWVKMPCEVTYTSKIILAIGSLKVYKLTRLLWLHMATKLKEIGLYVPVNNNQIVERLQQDIPKDKFRKTYNKQNLLHQEQTFKKAIELNPNNDSAYVGLGWLYRDQGRFAEEEQLLKKAIELNPNNDSAYVELGQLYGSQEKFTESEQAFKKALELNPKNDSAYLGLGRRYRNQGKLIDAEQAFKKALELNPNNDPAYTVLGRLYRDQGKFTELERIFKKALEVNPEDDRAIGGLATIYYGTMNFPRCMLKRRII
jgi:Flp pilus assembly protein TadD